MQSLKQSFTIHRKPWIAAAILLLAGLNSTAARSADADSTTSPTVPAVTTNLPTLFLIGDSTVNNGTKGLQGWGSAIGEFFDPAKIRVMNRARGGRSSRTFFTEGLWGKVLAEMNPGDFVLMQFGHNDGGSLTGPTHRASIKGNGDETQDVVNPVGGAAETVHTYGWYLRKYISDAKAKGATAIVLSPVPRNIWKDGKVARNSNDYGKWAAEAAKSEGVQFVDLNEVIADRYDALGEEKVKVFFPFEHTHTSPDGAKLNAESVIAGLKGLKDCPLCLDLSPAGGAVAAAAADPSKLSG